MATNNINKSISGVYGGHLLEQLWSLGSVIATCTKQTQNYEPVFTVEQMSFLGDIKNGRIEEGDTFLSILDHKDSLVRLVRTPNKNGIILTIPKVLDLVSKLSFLSMENKKQDYTWRTEQPETFCFQLLDLVSFIKESGSNIIELKSTSMERAMLNKLTSRTYYQSKNQIPKIFTPLLSARYDLAHFTKIAQTIHYNRLTHSQRESTCIDVRSCALDTYILRNEITFVRNGKYESLNILEV